MSAPLRPMTDPAREMADLLNGLSKGKTNAAGDRYLAEKFRVEPWTPDFYRVLATIMTRLAELQKIVGELQLDDDHRAEMVGHIREIEQAFTPTGFQSSWSSYALDKISARNLQPLKMLSGQVRQRIAYPKLTDDEVGEVAADVEQLLAWLEEHQLAEHDFIRQALIEGLRDLLFRLERFEWLGWGYTVDALRDVVGAYLALERSGVDVNSNPDAAVILAKVGEVVRTVYSKLEAAKNIADIGDLVLKVFAAATIVAASVPGITALLGPP